MGLPDQRTNCWVYLLAEQSDRVALLVEQLVNLLGGEIGLVFSAVLPFLNTIPNAKNRKSER